MVREIAKEITVTKGELKSLEVNNVWRAIVQLYKERKVILISELMEAENIYVMKRLQGELKELDFFLSLPDRFTEEMEVDEIPEEGEKDEK